MSTSHEQLRFLDEQLAAAALPPDQAELVQLHRLTGIQLRAARLADLGPEPASRTRAHAEWERRRKEVEADVELRLAETRLSVEGLEDSWEKWLHIEKLRAVREQLMQQTVAEGLAQAGLIGLQDTGAEEGRHDVGGDSNGHPANSPVPTLDSTVWEALQIAPLTSPNAWGLHLPAHSHEGPQPGEDTHDAAVQLHLQHQWQAVAHAQADLPQTSAQEPQAQPQEAAPAADGSAAPPAAAAEPEQGVPLKLCRRCNTAKPVTQFYRSKANADGYDGRCKACDAVQCAQRRKRKERVENPTVEWKACRRCQQTKPAADFYRNKTNPDGLYNNCKVCFSADAASRRERLPPLEQRTAIVKECRRCHEIKPAAAFYRNKHMSDGLYTHCKACYAAAANQRNASRAPTETKRCRRCSVTKDAGDFYPSKMTTDGLQSYCKECYTIASAERRSRADSRLEQAHGSQEGGQENEGLAGHMLQEHLLPAGMDQQQVVGMAHLAGGLDHGLQAAQLQQLGYDPAGVLQASLADHLGHLGEMQVQGLEHLGGHPELEVPHHHLGLPAPHHHLDPPERLSHGTHQGHLHGHGALQHLPASAGLSHAHEPVAL